MISRDLVEWFVERALEYQTLLPEDYKHDIRFEIIKRGFIVTIWSKEEDEDGICMYCYDSRPETGNWTGGWNRNIRDPYLSRAKKHVEKLIKEARDEAQKENF